MTKIFNIGGALLIGLLDWMEGSLFFRFVVRFFDFVKKVAAGSLILGIFIAPINEKEKRMVFFEGVVAKVLNNRFKPVKMPKLLPQFLSGFLSKSLIVENISNGLSVPIPAGGKAGAKQVFMWLFFAAPAWGTLLLVALTPVLPTMNLAFLLVFVIFFAFLSRKFEVNHYTTVLFLFMFVNFFAAITGFTKIQSLEIALLVSVFAFVSVLIPTVCEKTESIGFFLLAFLAGATVAGLVGIYQHLAGYAAGAWLDEVLRVYITFRVFSTFGNPNVYGIYLLLAIPLAAVCVLYFKNKFLKLLCAAVTLLLLANLLVTYSRGSYLALAFSLGVFVLLIEKRFIVLLLPAFVASLFVLPQSVIIRLRSILDFQDTSTAFRLSIWEGSARVLRDFWFTGIGQGSGAFSQVYPFYSLAATPTIHSHNLFLQMAIELGVFGLLVFIVLMACYFRMMANFLVGAKNLRQKFLAAVFIAAPCGVLLQGLFDHVFFSYRVLLSFFIFAGIGMACYKLYVSQHDSNVTPAENIILTEKT